MSRFDDPLMKFYNVNLLNFCNRFFLSIAAAVFIVLFVAANLYAAPVTSHPRLWLRSEDLTRLRSWAVDSNPLYKDGLALLAAQAKADMDAGLVPGSDTDNGGSTYVSYPAEEYAEIFAFMSLISSNQATRDAYAQRARTLLMYVINKAAQGLADGQPYRDPHFSISDRSRWHGEGFGLTVDWIYPYLSASDKATIRQVFLRWAEENINANTTTNNHPVPIGVINDPVLVSDREVIRWSTNNYYVAHMRNIGLMSMALDSADDANNTLGNYLKNATGAWLYVIDYFLRNDSSGGLPVEGFEYGPQSISYIMQLLLALHTAGQDDQAVLGPQVVLTGNPFYNDMVAGYLHSLSPATVTNSNLGQVYQPAWYGACQNYFAPDYIGVFGPLGIYDYMTGNTTRLQTLRWIQTNAAPGGAAGLANRANDSNSFTKAILYFMLFDPNASSPTDPHTAYSLNFFAPGLGRILARTDWSTDGALFDYKLSWNTTDHQGADGNHFEFYRKGEWLTKVRTGYDLDFMASDNYNTLSLENSAPAYNDPGDYRHMLYQRGSQWLYNGLGDPQLIAHSFGAGFVYALGDATNLYNSTYLNSTDILHASRSILWLKPDHVIVYDRASSITDGRFKRFWLNIPNQAVVSGTLSTMTTDKGQRLFVKTLLPSNATITSQLAPQEPSGNAANDEPMKYRLEVEATNGPKSVRFLHVLQGADSGINADAATLIQSTSGTSFAGALIGAKAVLFPVDVNTSFSTTTYIVPSSTSIHYITGLQAGQGYTVNKTDSGGNSTITISNGGTELADSGGVLVPCTYTISPTMQTFTSTGGTGSVSVTASGNSCAWTASSPLSWTTITSGIGTGSGTAGFTVSANTLGAGQRTGNITVADQTFVITQSDTAFADVVSTYGFYSYINAIYNAAITRGCSQNPLMYCPDASVTRGQMAAFIIRAKYGENFTYTQAPYFSDVPATNVFFKYVQKLKDDNITALTGTYYVDASVTRGQMAAFIIRAKYGESFTYTQTPYFSDVPATNVFFKYVQKMKDTGITTVTGTYYVDSAVTRGQMAAFIARAFLGMP